MENINFKDTNHLSDKLRKDWNAKDWIDEFYTFLQGNEVEGVSTSKHCTPKLNEKKAYMIIWYLQEHLRVLPSSIERCDTCGTLYDGDSEGIYWESKGKFFCGGCDYLVPENYDKGKR